MMWSTTETMPEEDLDDFLRLHLAELDTWDAAPTQVLRESLQGTPRDHHCDARSEEAIQVAAHPPQAAQRRGSLRAQGETQERVDGFPGTLLFKYYA